MRLEELTYDELHCLVHKVASKKLIELIDEIVIPEANVFRCRFSGKRINLKFDVDFGASLEPVDSCTQQELMQVEAILVGAPLGS